MPAEISNSLNHTGPSLVLTCGCSHESKMMTMLRLSCKRSTSSPHTSHILPSSGRNKHSCPQTTSLLILLRLSMRKASNRNHCSNLLQLQSTNRRSLASQKSKSTSTSQLTLNSSSHRSLYYSQSKTHEFHSTSRHQLLLLHKLKCKLNQTHQELSMRWSSLISESSQKSHREVSNSINRCNNSNRAPTSSD